LEAYQLMRRVINCISDVFVVFFILVAFIIFVIGDKLFGWDDEE